MTRTTARMVLLLLCLAAFCAGLHAQSEKTVTIRMLDGKTGLLISTTNFLVRVNHLEAAHGDWVRENEDGTGALTLPADAEMVSIHATYEAATLIYANCDADKDRRSSDHAAGLDHWYSVASILTSGVVATNDCVGKKIPERLQVIAKPGEFVFFVRPLSAPERFRN